MENKEEVNIFNQMLSNYRNVDVNENIEQIRKRCLPKIQVCDKTNDAIFKINNILKEKITQNLSLEELHTLIYCGAKTVLKLCEDKNIPIYYNSDIPKVFPSDEKNQTELFQRSGQIFKRLLYSDIELTNVETPSAEQFENVWSEFWAKESTYKNEAQKYIEQEQNRMKAKKNVLMDTFKITLSDFKKALKNKKNWAPPGVDGIQFFWYKKFTCVHEVLVKKINEIIEHPEYMPNFFTQGLTEMFPKSTDTQCVLKYRPITHLPTIYKIISRCIYEKIFFHFNNFRIIAEEQCGGRKGNFGVRKALIIDSIALSQDQVWGCYVDYKKAFDLVSHSWILKLFEIYGVDMTVLKFLEKAMENWKTRIYVAVGEPILTNTIPMKRGIFHGDPLSVLFYWTIVNPLSFALHQKTLGLKLKNGGVISHVLYVDDLKLYSSNLKDLEEMFEIVAHFTDAISMEINEKKSHTFSIPKQLNQSIKDLEYSQHEIYLGYNQGPRLNHGQLIYRKTWSFEKKLQKLEGTSLSTEDKNLFVKLFLNTSICKSFGVLRWRVFKRKLLELHFNLSKCLDIVKENCGHLNPIYFKLFDDTLKMRRNFHDQSGVSLLMKFIIQNDTTVTPLYLSLLNETQYVQQMLEQIQKTKGKSEGKSKKSKKQNL